MDAGNDADRYWLNRDCRVVLSLATSVRIKGSFVDRSLLSRDHCIRYDMHPVIQQCAQEQLEASPVEVTAVQDRHRRYFLDLVSQGLWELCGANFDKGMAAFELELDNIRAAWRYAIDHRMVHELRQGMRIMFWFYDLAGKYHDGHRAFHQIGAMDAANSSEPIGRARVCQSNPSRGIPMPPSLRLTLGHCATAASPPRQVANTSSSRLA